MYTTSSCILTKSSSLTCNSTYNASSCLPTYMRPFSFFLVMSNNLKLIISGCQAYLSIPHTSMAYPLCTFMIIHENLGIEMVMDAFVRYVAMAFVKDKIYPNKAYVDISWFTENWRKSGRKACAKPCKGCFQLSTLILKETEVDLIDAQLHEDVEPIHNMKIKGERWTMIKIGLPPQRNVHFWIKQFPTHTS